MKEIDHIRGAVRVLLRLLVVTIALACVAAAEAANPTTLSINCTPKGVSPGTPTSCVATVTDAGPVASRVPPAGTVTLTTSGAGTFDLGDSCTLEPFGAFSSRCTVSYTPTAISGGSHRLSGAYNGEDGHGRATSAFTLAVTPANDDITSAAPLPVPGKLAGTTEGATYSDDDPELCNDAYAPVWYSLRPARSGRLAVRLTVNGRVDAVVAVFRQDRTKLVDLGCDSSSASGVAGVPFDAVSGTTYVVAVAAPWSATAGEFTLESFLVPPVAFPGRRVTRDTDLALDPLLRPVAALSVPVREGTTYRIDATARSACVHVEALHRANASSDALARSEGCSGYLVFTPGPGAGRVLPLLVSLPAGSAAKVHVAIRPAQVDDLAPGLLLPAATVRHGRLAARDADAVDVYTFRVPAESDATIDLRGSVHVDLLVFDRSGRQVACACRGGTRVTIERRFEPGSYLAAVRARPAETGAYAILLRLRQPTSTTVQLGSTTGAHPQLAVGATTRPRNVGGHLVLELERFDPLSAWQFVATVRHGAGGGRTTFWLQPRVGAWRVRARYDGTLSASRSTSAWIAFTVEPKTRAGGQRAVRCAPGSAGTFAVGTLTLTCGGAGVGGKATSTTPSAKTPSAQLRDLRASVSGLSTLKEPFKGQLIGNVDAAIEALAGGNTDEARAQLDEFIATVQSAPVVAQLTAGQRDQLVATARGIEGQISP